MRDFRNLKINCRLNKYDELIAEEILKKKCYEKYFKLNKGNWLDIGAHIGTFSLLLAKEGNTVVSYEPEYENFEMLEKNIKDNNFANLIVAKQSAIVGNDDEKRTLFVNTKKNTGANTLFIRRRNSKIHEDVNCVNINDALENIENIKIDCEGTEYEILMNIKSFDKIKQIVLEYHFFILGKDKYFEIVKLLKEKGFKVYYKGIPEKRRTIIGAEKNG